MGSDQNLRGNSVRLRARQDDSSDWPCWIPKWLMPLIRRLVNLEQGRYLIVVTVSEDEADWSVQPLGKVERHLET